METQIKTAHVFVDQEAPSIEILKNQVFSAIMELTDEEKVRVLSKYSKKYKMLLSF